MTKIQEKQLKKMDRALDYFTESVKRSPIKSDVFKIILYGSLLDKKIHKGSDIDLAIIAKKNLKKVEKEIDELSYEVVLEHGELIEPIIYSLKEYEKPRSPFLMKIMKNGKEVYAEV